MRFLTVHYFFLSFFWIIESIVAIVSIVANVSERLHSCRYPVIHVYQIGLTGRLLYGPQSEYAACPIFLNANSPVVGVSPTYANFKKVPKRLILRSSTRLKRKNTLGKIVRDASPSQG